MNQNNWNRKVIDMIPNVTHALFSHTTFEDFQIVLARFSLLARTQFPCVLNMFTLVSGLMKLKMES